MRGKSHKYNAKTTYVDQIAFKSKLEAKRYQILKLLQKAGEIKFFLLQPRFELPGGTRYTADFEIHWSNGNVTFEDVKGVLTKEFVKNKKQVEAIYPVNIEVLKKGNF